MIETVELFLMLLFRAWIIRLPVQQFRDYLDPSRRAAVIRETSNLFAAITLWQNEMVERLPGCRTATLSYRLPGFADSQNFDGLFS